MVGRSVGVFLLAFVLLNVMGEGCFAEEDIDGDGRLDDSADENDIDGDGRQDVVSTIATQRSPTLTRKSGMIGSPGPSSGVLAAERVVGGRGGQRPGWRDERQTRI